MESTNVRTALAQVEAFNRRDLDAQVSGYADQFKATDHGRGATMTTRDEVKAWNEEWIASSSDARVQVERVIDGGSAVVSVLVLEGTNDGPMGPIPPTGRRITARGVQILTFDAG